MDLHSQGLIWCSVELKLGICLCFSLEVWICWKQLDVLFMSISCGSHRPVFLDSIQWNRFPWSTAMGLKGSCETSVSYAQRNPWTSQSTRDYRILSSLPPGIWKLRVRPQSFFFFFFASKYKETSGSLFTYWLVNIEFLFSNTHALIVVEINLFLNEKPDSLAIATLEKLTACFATLLGWTEYSCRLLLPPEVDLLHLDLCIVQVITPELRNW